MSLFASGGVKKYLFYAVGEITLVVIGILIALQINNWNTNRIERSREHNIVQLISQEIAFNSSYVENWIKNCNSKLDVAIKLVNLTGSSPQPISSDSLGSYLGRVFGLALFTPTTNHFNRIVNGDEINYITHDSLKFLLGELNNSYKSTEAFFEFISNKYVTQKWKLIENGVMNFAYFDYWGNRLDLRGFDKIDGDRFERNYNELLSSQGFESVVMSQINYLQFFIEHLEAMTIVMEDLQEFIDHNYSDN